MYIYIYKGLEGVLAIILFVISLGIYQSYIGVVIGLTVMRLIRDLFDDEISTKWFFINGIIMVLIVVIGGLVYLGVTEIVLSNMGLELSNYKGAENISIKNTLTNLPSSIKKAYKDFCSYYLNDLIVYNEIYLRDLFYKIMFASVFILEGISMITNKLYKKPYKIFLITIANAVLPIALNAVLLLTTDTSTYVLTAAQLILMIPFSAMICEIAGKKMTFIFRWATLVSMFLVVFTYYLADNVSYHCLKQTYNQAYTTVIRIVDRIEQTEGYTKEGLVLINGIIETNMDYRYQRMSPLGDYTVGMFFKECPVFHGTYSGMEGTWMNFFTNYMGMKVQLCSVGDYQNIVQTPEYQEMGIWPAEDSVKLINNIIVVKLREQAIMP
ncbi:MAG: glucosyltransferase domain-containing protein [Clostridia bacterium]|nr:glucosyltransferase domain-containing protein [Clostridia bacterium]